MNDVFIMTGRVCGVSAKTLNVWCLPSEGDVGTVQANISFTG